MESRADSRADPLAFPAFRRLLVGRVLGVLGRQILSVSVGWQIYDRTHSAWALGFVGLVQVVPVVLLAVPAGVTADRADRRMVAVATQLVLALLGLAMVLITQRDAPIGWVFPVLLGCGCVTAFSAPAISSLTPNLVPPSAFVRANAWNATTFELAAIGGPAAAGGLLAWLGPGFAYGCVTVLALAFAVTLAGLPEVRSQETARAAHERSEELRAGVRFVLRSRYLLPAITLDLFAVLFGGVTALLPIFAKDLLAVGPAGLGWMRAAPSAGALTMALLTTRLPPFRRPGRALLLAVLGFGAATVGFALSRSLGWSLAFLFLTGLCDNVSVVIRQTLVQVVTPDALRGRVAAVHFVFIGLSNELGAFESGVTAALLGPVGSVLLGGVATFVVVAVVVQRWPELWRVGPLESLGPDAALAPHSSAEAVVAELGTAP
ncbi:MAG: MFS transporter [bacterium]